MKTSDKREKALPVGAFGTSLRMTSIFLRVRPRVLELRSKIKSKNLCLDLQKLSGKRTNEAISTFSVLNLDLERSDKTVLTHSVFVVSTVKTGYKSPVCPTKKATLKRSRHLSIIIYKERLIPSLGSCDLYAVGDI